MTSLDNTLHMVDKARLESHTGGGTSILLSDS